MTVLRASKVCPGEAQGSLLVERLGLAQPAAKIAVDAQGVVQRACRSLAVACYPPDGGEVAQGVRLAEVVSAAIPR